ncbi:MAG: Asp-tRNA(Asn)/Glu-tRNA(Gln) amidotransferase subunit GatA [Candidatus Zixiibacteriota bacterium]
MINDYGQTTVKDITDGLQKKRFSAVELCHAALSTVEQKNRNLNALITATGKLAVEQAEQIDKKISLGENPGFLAGIPVIIKDNICLSGYPTTCASKMLANFISPYNATCVEKLINAGAVIIGKANMDEFAMGSSNETSYLGPVKNPYGDEYVPGGSSGGSAAAVAAGMAPIALGSDTGGSVRQPAAFCGVYGLKPTYGAVSRYGLVAFASSMDQIGPMARKIDDLARLFSVISGHDENDSTSMEFDYSNIMSELDTDRKFVIGLPRVFFMKDLDSEIADIFEKAVAMLSQAGHRIVEIDLPHIDLAIATYYVIANAEASSNLARYDGVRYGLRVPDDDLIEIMCRTRSSGFGREVIRRIMLGTYVLSAGCCEVYYNRATQIRNLIKSDFADAFKEIDLILIPTTPTAAFKIGEKIDNPLEMYLSDIFTVPANLAGIPAISIPFGKVKDGRPAGIQFMARAFDEISLFRIGRCLEKMNGE